MLPFQAIYLDTNVFIEASWPRLSAKFTEAASLARLGKAEFVLLDPVEDELAAHWKRELEKRYRDVRRLTGQIDASLAFTEDHRPNLTLPSIADALASYQRSVNQLKSSFTQAPMTSMPLSELFKRAVNREAPFLQNESNPPLQDAVIYFSAIEHLKLTGLSGAFVSNDNRFADQGVRQLAQAMGAKLEFYQKLDDLFVPLQALIKEVLTIEHEKDREKATEALRERKAQIESFLTESLEFTKSDFSHPSAECKSVSRIELTDISSVHMSPLVFERKPDHKVELSFDAMTNFHVEWKLDPWAGLGLLFSRPVMKVGQPEVIPELKTPEKPPSPVQPRTVQVQAEADFKNGEYSNIRFTSARLFGSPIERLIATYRSR